MLPCKTAELRVMDLDESITPTEVAEAIAATGSFSRTGIKVGEFSKTGARLAMVWSLDAGTTHSDTPSCGC